MVEDGPTNDASGFFRQRRNLIFVTIALLFSQTYTLKVTVINVLGTVVVNPDTPIHLQYALWAPFLYCCWRYFSYYRASSGERELSGSRYNFLEPLLSSKAKLLARTSYVTDGAASFGNEVDRRRYGQQNLGEIKEVRIEIKKNEPWHWEFHPTYIFENSSVTIPAKSIAFRSRQLLVPNMKALGCCIWCQKSFTDYSFPALLALSPFFVLVYQFWK